VGDANGIRRREANVDARIKRRKLREVGGGKTETSEREGGRRGGGVRGGEGVVGSRERALKKGGTVERMQRA